MDHWRHDERAEIPARILVAGSDLLSDVLSNALKTYGFATMHIAFGRSEIRPRDRMGSRPRHSRYRAPGPHAWDFDHHAPT